MSDAPEPELTFSWRDPELAEVLRNVLLISDAEAATVTLNRGVGDVGFICLRLRTRTKEGIRGELALAITREQADLVATVLLKLDRVAHPGERRN